MARPDFEVDEPTGEWERAHDHKTPADFGTPVEMRFVLDIRDHPDDLATRMVYADWLEQHGKAERAELVRLLADPPEEGSPRYRQLKLLGARESREWLAVVGRAPIEACAPTFRFRCPKRWEALTSTDSPDVRHCASCNREVHFCADLDDVARHARQGNCVALSSLLRRARATEHYELMSRIDDVEMGEVADPSEWAPPPDET